MEDPRAVGVEGDFAARVEPQAQVAAARRLVDHAGRGVLRAGATCVCTASPTNLARTRAVLRGGVELMSSNGLLFATPTSDLLAVDDRLLGHMELRIRVPCGGTADRAGAGRAGHGNARRLWVTDRNPRHRHGLNYATLTGRLPLAHAIHGQGDDEPQERGGGGTCLSRTQRRGHGKEFSGEVCVLREGTHRQP